jgi:chromosome segregation ATPase
MEEEKNELWSTLTRFHREVTMPEMLRFHREVAMPELREMVSATVDSSVGALRNEMNAHFDAIYKRIERLETELTALKAGMKRLEASMESLNIVALRSKLEELRAELKDAEQRLSALESRR